MTQTYIIKSCVVIRHLHSFPTRRSSDLAVGDHEIRKPELPAERADDFAPEPIGRLRSVSLFDTAQLLDAQKEDRKSTRLNSSHGYISYAVFCLKKKKVNHKNMHIEYNAV